MINTSVNKNEHTIQSGVVDYPIGFPFYFNPDRTPQLLVKIGNEELRFNYNFELSEDNGSVVLKPTEEESWTLEGPEDFSWMTKWDGKDLLIERAVPFVQDSDYQLGRISSEQIERDFDLSVMRDQMLSDEISERADGVQGEIDALGGRVSSIEGKIPESVSGSNPLVVKDTLNGYVKKSGDTVDGDIRLNGASIFFAADETDRARAAISWGIDGFEIKTGVAFADRYYFDSTKFYASSGIKLGISSNPWTIAYIQTLNNGSDISVPAEGGTLARLEDLTDFAKKGDLSGYLPLTGKSFLSAWLGFDFVGEPGGNHAIIAAQTLDGVKGVAAIELDSEGRPTDILYVRKLKSPTANISVLLGTRIGGATTPIHQIHALKIGTGLSSHMLDIPDGPGTLARIEDINEAVANKQDKLTAGDNITIVDNVISAIDSSGITEVAHDDTLTGNGTTDSPLGLAETIKSEIAGKQKQLHPGTNVFINSVNPDYDIISVPNMVSSLNGLSGALNLQAGDGIAIDGLKISATGSGGASYTAGDGIDITGDTISVASNILKNNADYNDTALAVGPGSNAIYNFGTAVGSQASAGMSGIALGDHAVAFGDHSVAICTVGNTNAKFAIQLGGYGKSNNDVNTFKVGNENGNFEMMDANGNVPLERLTYVTNQIGDISTALTAILGE